MRPIAIIPAAVAALALLGGPAMAQGASDVTGDGVICAGDDPNYFTPRITEVGPGSMVRSGCAGALELSPEGRIGAGIGAAPSNDLQWRIDRLTLMPNDERRSVFVVTGDSDNFIMGARGAIGGFSVGGYLAYPNGSSDRADDHGNLPDSYGLGAAYGGDAWWIGLAYRRLGPDAGRGSFETDAQDALELSGQYELGSGINLKGSFGWADRRITGAGREDTDDGGWYIIGSVKIPF